MKKKWVFAGLLAGLAALVAAAAVLAETDAAREFKRITDDLRAKQQTMSSYQYIDLIERSFTDFIKRYPKSPEAGQAHFVLGRVYSGIGAPERAIEHLEAYLASQAPRSADETAQAKLVLASSYLALDRYDEAEKLLREVAGAGLAVDQRIVQAAQGELSRVDALRKIKIGAPAPGVAGTSHQGRSIDLAKLRGKVVLLDFWAAWCAPCRMEMPNVIKTYSDYNKKGFEIIGISLDNNRTDFENFLRDNKMTWPQLYEGSGWGSSVARSYAVNSIPATFLVDRKGNLRYKNLRGPKLREAVEALLAEK